MQAIAISAGLSALAILIWLMVSMRHDSVARIHSSSGQTIRRQRQTYHRTHIFAYYVSLLVANALQAAGTLMNFNWVAQGYVVSGPYCSAQGDEAPFNNRLVAKLGTGALKQAGNVGTAMWSFMIAIHLLNLLFLRRKTTVIGLIITLFGGWSVLATIIFIGPGLIQTQAQGPYFGVSGFWCWITHEYPREQFFLEYFFVSYGIND